MPNHQQNPDSLFLAASEIESAEERTAFLANACGNDHKLRQQVQQLLQSAEQDSSLLNKPSAELEATIVPGASPVEPTASLATGLEAAGGEDQSVVTGNASQSVLQSLSHTINVPRVLLKDADDDEPIARPNSPEIPNGNSDSRYQLLGEIARGGMGAILKGRDTDLGRDLAIKVLLDSHKDKPEIIQRFIEEAQIGGQLQHPGIAPIYELGQFKDQRPFFSMKLVKGETLAKLLADRDDPTVDRGKLLGIFEQICQTMAYAHSRGVIHRDLKPANIMVGAFGEVQVMDWGLAKVLSFGGVADEKAAKLKQHGASIIQTMRSAGSEIPGSFGSFGSAGTETQMGSVMGTPAYMPPEQALGEIDQLDQRADVFGLGAILCEILTGQPPYIGEDGTQVFRLACRGKLGDAFSRLDSCAADAELLTLAKHCLELEPAKRPKDGAALALGISHYLEAVETKLRETELAKVDAQARAEEIGRRQKLAFRAGAAIALTLLVGIGVSGWQAVRATRAENLATTAAQNATDEAARAIAAERKTKDTLVQVAAERDAKDQARKDAEAISTFLTEVFQSPDPERDGRTITVAETLDTAAKQLETKLNDQPERRTKLQATLAKTYYALGLHQDAIPLQEKVRDNYLSVSGPQQPETLTALHVLATSYVRAGRRDEATQIQEDVLKQRRKLLGSEHPDTLQTMHALSVSYFYAGRRDEALQMQEDGLEMHRKVLGPEHTDTLKVMPALAVSYFYAGRRDEALQMQEEVLKLYRKLLAPENPKTLLAMTNLASFYSQARRLDEALQIREEVLKLSQKVLGQQHPSTLLAMQNLATSYFEAERFEASLQMRKEVLTLRQKVLGKQHPGTQDAMENMAISNFQAGLMDEAMQMQEEVLQLRLKTVGPKHSDTLYGMNKLAKFYYDAGRNDQAIALYEEIAELDAKTTNTLNLLAWPLVFTPNPQGNFPLAEQATLWARQACELAPDDANLRNTLAVALYRSQKWQKAIEALQQSIKSGSDTPHNWLFLAMAHWHLNNKPEAKRWYDKSMAWQTANAEEAKADSGLPIFYAEASKLMATNKPKEPNGEPNIQTTPADDDSSETDSPDSPSIEVPAKPDGTIGKE